jgi:hypothetical protein
VIGSIVVAGVATPVYRQDYFIGRGDLRLTWFNMTEVSLGFIFLIEFGIKVLADGFLFCPNAYLLSIWNDFDFFILLTLLVNVVTALISGGAVSRLTRVLKALRALRLITLLPRIRSTFYHVLILGASKLLDASVLAVLYIIPYAAWGQNIFSGLLFFCNDSLVANKLQCVGEYVAAPAEWPFLAPRVWANPYVWSFDSFRNSFLILFEIISLEGWTSVLQTGQPFPVLQAQADAQFSDGDFRSRSATSPRRKSDQRAVFRGLYPGWRHHNSCPFHLRHHREFHSLVRSRAAHNRATPVDRSEETPQASASVQEAA